MLYYVKTIAAADVGPVAVEDRALVVAAGAGPTSVVLKTAGKVVERLAIVGKNLVELADRNVADPLPGFAAIVADRNPAILPLPHAIRILRINPHGVVVAVSGGGDAADGPAAVDGGREAHADGVDAILVGGVDGEVAVVEAASHDHRILGHHAEVVAPIVAAIERAFARFADHVHHVGIRRRHAHADPAP